MYEVRASSGHKKNNKLRWLASDINLNCYTLGVLLLKAGSTVNLNFENQAVTHQNGELPLASRFTHPQLSAFPQQ